MAEKGNIKMNKKMEDKVKVERESLSKKAEKKVDEKKMEGKKEETKKNGQKKGGEKVIKKDYAIARGWSLKISPKYSVYVCKTIKGKSPEMAVQRLEEVISERRPIPMAGLEVGHKKGKGLAGGKFPKNVCKEVIEVIKQAEANANVNGIEEPIITIAKSDRASAPLRRGGRQAKRTHIFIEVRSKQSLAGGKK